jgi:hypothetical protein
MYDFVVFSFYLSIGFVGKFPAKTINTCNPPPPPRFFNLRSAKKVSKICEASGKREIVGGVNVKKIRAKYNQGSDIASISLIGSFVASDKAHYCTVKCCFKVHKIEKFFGSEFEFCTISLLVLLK